MTARMAGSFASAEVSETRVLRVQGYSDAYVSGAQKPVPGGNLRCNGQRSKLLRQAEHRVLTGPLDRRISQTLDANPARQPTFDGGPHKIGRRKARDTVILT